MTKSETMHMKFYQIKSTEKGSEPAIWYRTLVPSGITFSQLYVLLSCVHGMMHYITQYFSFETKDRAQLIEEFEDGEPASGSSFHDKYDSAGTYIDDFFEKGYKISLYTGTDFDLKIEVEKDAAEYESLAAPQVIKVSRAVAAEEGGQPDGETLPEETFGIVPTEERDFASAEELVDRYDTGRGTLMRVSKDPVTPEESISRGRLRRDLDEMQEIIAQLHEDKSLAVLLTAVDDPECDERADRKSVV